MDDCEGLYGCEMEQWLAKLVIAAGIEDGVA